MADDNKDLTTVDDGTDADFEAGFNAPAATSKLVVAEGVAPVVDLKEAGKTDEKPEGDKPEGDKPADTPPADKKDETPPPADPDAEVVSLTKGQLTKLEAAAARGDDFAQKFDKIFGTIGGMQQVVNQLQASTPKGGKIEITDEVVAEMAEEYPELAKHFKTSLERVVTNMRGTGTAAEGTPIDKSAISEIVAEGVKQQQVEALEEEYPDWKQIVGAVASPDKADQNNPFRKWLGAQPADYQKKVNSTHNASTLMTAITRFKVDAAKQPAPKVPQPKDTSRAKRIEAAVVPKGDGAVPKPKPTDDDAFEEGFRSG